MLIEISVGWTLFLLLLTVIGMLSQYDKDKKIGVVILSIAIH